MKQMYIFRSRLFCSFAPGAIFSLLLALLLSVTSFAQTGSGILIKGIVTDENNAALPGVTVAVRGTAKGTTTNANGAYTLTVNSREDVLVFSLMGTQSKEVKVEDKDVINVTLINDTKQLKDVVVIGYGTASKKDVTGSITTIKSEEFNQGVLTTPAELLQGKVPGLNVTKSGDPNAAPAVVLRGPSTIRASGGAMEPFYVIDGVPGASIDLLAPADIESMDVLKDASATAIYGARAANGVIMITTKRAKAGQTRLSYNAYVSMEEVSKRYDMLSANELRDYLKKSGQTLNPVDDDGSNTNWQDLILRKGYSHNHNISFGGATATTDYGGSVNYLNNQGVMRNTDLTRTVVRGYINQRYFNNRLRLSLAVTNSSTKGNNIAQENVLPGMIFYLPTVSPYNTDGSYKENLTRTGSGPYNPLALLNSAMTRNDNNKTLINGIIQVEIIKGLKYTLSGSTQRDQSNINTYLTRTFAPVLTANGRATRTSYLNTSTVLESYFNYDRDFGAHSVKLLGGYTFQQDKTNDGFGVTTQNFSNDALTYNNLYLSNPTNISQIVFDNNPISTLRLISYYGRVQYAYAGKYLFQASLRNDGSSAFGKNNRWGYFPAVSAGWNISNERFMKNIRLISQLKLRAGYGVSGNSAGFNAFTALLVYGTPTGNTKFQYNGNITNAINLVRNENPDLKWESTATANIGLDFGILNDRINGSVDYYIKKTSDLIYDQYPVSTTQYIIPTFTANVGRIRNSGIELIINAVPVKTGDFTWRTSVNLAHNKNRVEKLSNDKFTINYIETAQLGGKGQSGIYSQIVKNGYALGTFNLWHYTGKDSAGISTYQKADGKITNQQPLTTDARISGDAQPALIYGWTNSFFFKGFDLNFLIRGVTGNKILNSTLAALNNPADAKLQNIPRFTLEESFRDRNAYLRSDRFLESGSYLRMDNITLGYTFKPRTQAVKSLRFYVSANNLFVITGYRGIDPEVNIGGLTPGIDNNNLYPKTRTYMAGLSASF
jgi:iron complex outermembrane receptor protein